MVPCVTRSYVVMLSVICDEWLLPCNEEQFSIICAILVFKKWLPTYVLLCFLKANQSMNSEWWTQYGMHVFYWIPGGGGCLNKKSCRITTKGIPMLK